MAEKHARCDKTPIENVYDGAYKTATAVGEHNTGAHIRGLEAVYDWALLSAKAKPFRMMAYRAAVWLHRKVRPY